MTFTGGKRADMNVLHCIFVLMLKISEMRKIGKIFSNSFSHMDITYIPITCIIYATAYEHYMWLKYNEVCVNLGNWKVF